MIESAEEFVRLSSSDVPEEYRTARLDWAPEEVWLDVIARFPDYKTWVIHNKTVPLNILDLLSTDPDPHVRGAVAWKRKLSRELFERLAADPDHNVRGTLTRNAKLPIDILHRLTRDPSPWVRQRAAEAIEIKGLPAPEATRDRDTT